MAVAHLVKDNQQIKTNLRHFLKFFIATLQNDNLLVDKNSALWRYDEFFKSAKIDLHTFTNFFMGILKKPDANNLE